MTDALIRNIQHDTFRYFLHERNPANGLVADSTGKNPHASVTAVGLGLTAYLVGIERGYISREDAIQQVLTTLRFFWNSPQDDSPEATGYKGFYYHFLDMKTGRRARESELSTIDTTFLLAGALAAATYFDGEGDDETEIRRLADDLYRRTDWQWALNEGIAVSLGWKPETGFIKHRWLGYSEALLLYCLGLGSPTCPLPPQSYTGWLATYTWKKLYGYEYLYAGPLFIHQLSHIWIDFRGIQDAYMREKQSNYFENSRRATYVQQQYAMRNTRGFKDYGEHIWGITAGHGPGPVRRRINGVERRFYDYEARGVPFGPDDGTLAPWAQMASLPFAPEIVLPAIDYLHTNYPEITNHYGLKSSFNPTFRVKGKESWIDKKYYGLDQGPVVLMIENYLTSMVWKLMKRCPYLVDGLRRAGFTGGWL
jgi:hypothetical protein